MYAAIDNGTILAICHDAENAWDVLGKQSGSYSDAMAAYAAVEANLHNLHPNIPPQNFNTLINMLQNTILRQHGVGVTRVVQDADGAWRATNY